MNRRKKEADQHKGWNISISGVFIAMVMGIVLISVVAATLIFVQIYRNAMEQSAVTSSSQSCEQVQNTVENYTQDMRIILEGIVARMRHENNHSEEYIQNLVNIRSDVVAVTICGEDGEAILYDGSYHPVDSSEMAFKTASIQAFKKGFLEASPVLLEPIASLKVTVPDKFTGDVMGDLNKRRGRVLGMNPDHKGNRIVEADIPMMELYGYCTTLRSMTGGSGDFAYEFARYEQAPKDIMDKEIAARAGEE